MTRRRQHSAEFKAKVALEALRGEWTINKLAAEYGVYPVQITQWKKVVLEELPKVFSSCRGAEVKEEAALKAALYQQIGPLKVELDWLKKKLGISIEAKRQLVEPPSADQPASPMCPVGLGPVGAVLSARRPQRRGCGS